jgi:hypothetical protein
VPGRRWFITTVVLEHMLNGAAAFIPASLVIRCTLWHAPTDISPWAMPLIARRRTSFSLRQPTFARAVVHGVRKAGRREVAMAYVYSAELTFKPLNVQQEFFVAKTLGSIALPGSVFHCDTESDGKVLSHFKFDLELAGSVSDARQFLHEQFPGFLDRGGARSGNALAPPEEIVVNPALFTYAAQVSFEALSDVQEVFVASALQSFALPNTTYVMFGEGSKADGSSASFRFLFELGGTLQDARVLVQSKFPQAINRSPPSACPRACGMDSRGIFSVVVYYCST